MKALLAEFTGTFSLVFFGTGAIVADAYSGGMITSLGVASAFGLTVCAMIFIFADVSGAHLNPAVTLSFAVAAKFPFRGVLPYFGSQLAGGCAASALLHFLFPSDLVLGGTHPSGSLLESFLLEVVLSFVLMMTILRIAENGRQHRLLSASVVGMVVLLEAFFAGPISGASMNPVRSLAPAIVTSNYQYVWIYLFAPFLGMVLAVPFRKNIKPSLIDRS